MPCTVPQPARSAEAPPKEATPTRDSPIGVFDSGVGGLTVVQALRARLPAEELLYLGDTARVPYGVRSPAVVRRYAAECGAFLQQQGAKMVVVACNTASAHALPWLEDCLSVPVVGVLEAGVFAAAQHFANGRVGVLATPGTVQSQAYVTALRARAPHMDVRQQACPLFVPLCEEGLMDHPATRLLAEDALRALMADGWRPDALLLGCTHYPLLSPLLETLVGPAVTLVNSAVAVAHQVAFALEQTNLARPAPAAAATAQQTTPRAPLTLYATDVTSRLGQVAARFLGEPLGGIRPVTLM